MILTGGGGAPIDFFGGDGVSKISAAAAFGGVTVNNGTHKFSGTSNIHYIDCSIGSLISRVTVEFWRYGLKGRNGVWH